MFNNTKKPQDLGEKKDLKEEKSWNEKTSSYSFMLGKINPQAEQKRVNTAVADKSASIGIRSKVAGADHEHPDSNTHRPAPRKTKSK